MTSFMRLASMEVKLFFREKMAVFWTFMFPVLILWLMGSLFGEQMGMETFATLYIPAWMGVNVLTIGLFGIGTVLTEYREKEILRRYQATPLRPLSIVGAQMMQGAVILLISAIILLSFGRIAYGLSFPQYPLSTILALALSVIAIFPFSVLITSLAKNSRTAAAISSVVFNLMMFLSGAAFPLEMMPTFLQWVAKFLPLYYVIYLLQQTWNESSLWENGMEIGVLSGIAIISTLMAVKYFRWNRRQEN
ncbi:ABC transporter permease [Mechercharimyces sp. CAU 1602]|uniref:ABC transporter permease n=1 Tax=Mechercharimyces sp. CAU 1602 TaxID=2973933 RepID=UPI002161C18B|nr:ABC transporter permease [Mechercharimyces sp. CAU 1602]MCS1350075.1 ABC transporter permease [Mechercharimyces sp. CAU 1602]